MSADLHIHAFVEGVTECDLRTFKSNQLGSKYFAGLFAAPIPFEERNEVSDRISNVPSIWIGEVSWLKAGLFENGRERFIPNTVARIAELIGEELPVLDDSLAEQLLAAFDFENTTSYRLACRRLRSGSPSIEVLDCSR